MKKTIALFMMAGLLFACSDDDDKTTALEGSWDVKTYSSEAGFLEPADGEMTWKFRGDDLTIDNDIHAAHPYTIPSGHYDFSVSNGVVTIESGEYDYTLDGNMLTLASELEPVDGGPVITFEKN